MSDDENISIPVRALRIDLIIAICALLFSALATTASWWQTRVIAQQLGAQVWPFVTITTLVAPNRLEVDVANDGLGPAIVKSFVVTVDGKAQHDLGALLRFIVTPAATQSSKIHSALFANLDPGEVLRPSSSKPLLHLRDPHIIASVVQQTGASGWNCYCSILETCWQATLPAGERREQATCVARGADQLHDIPPGMKDPLSP